MNYAEISKETIGHLHKSYASLKTSPLDPVLRAMIELRVSQINGCAYCCGVHAEEARKLGVEQEKIDVLSVWANSDAFSEEELAALEWAESLTFMEGGLDEKREGLFEFFTERQVVDLTACVSIMNALNRMAVALKDS